ncbi:TetR/AcrR family transcriptional regulator [Symbioplanes lichenis]|uniref:TetR/AcrR family transcriptional regulator n=1 Tax=Symbioplanes lichenis TaxID=1629072 RepID=UPI002739BF5C|nr:TetR family transcriptional regulator [Actinoplanes lichenis]
MAAGTRPRGAGRVQVLETARRLFTLHGVEGTSLQAIADLMGVSKAAVYYHFKTKDDLVRGVLEPIIAGIAELARVIGAQRGRNARLDAMLIGIVDLAVAHNDEFQVVMGDPYIGSVLQAEVDALGFAELAESLALTGTDPATMATRVALSVFVTGLRGPLTDPELLALGDAALREHLIESGRRLLGIRRRPHAL